MKLFTKNLKLTLYSVLFLTGFIFFSGVNDSNGRAGVTGAPGESTCNQSNCHTGVAVNSQGGSVTIVCPTMPNWQYTPGEVYTVQVIVTQSGRSLFGFGFEALQDNGDNAGTLAFGTGSSIKTKVVSGFTRKSVVHTLNSGATANSHTWTFNWTAPASNIGNITFYCAGNAANGNGSKTGDYIYTTSQVITPGAVGIVETKAPKGDVSIYPNPVENEINVNYTLPNAGQVRAEVYSITGQKMAVLMDEAQERGDQLRAVEVVNLASGNYFLVLFLDDRPFSSQHFSHR